jgi:hypothetical protein
MRRKKRDKRSELAVKYLLPRTRSAAAMEVGVGAFASDLDQMLR